MKKRFSFFRSCIGESSLCVLYSVMPNYKLGCKSQDPPTGYLERLSRDQRYLSIETPHAIHLHSIPFPTLASTQSVVCVKASLVLSSQSRGYRQGSSTMLPAQRKKINMSVRTSFDPESDIPSSIARLTTAACDSERMCRCRRYGGC